MQRTSLIIASLRKTIKSLLPFRLSTPSINMSLPVEPERRIWIRSCNGEPRMQASFEVKRLDGSLRTFNLNRYVDESVSTTLERLANNINSKVKVSKKRKKTLEGDEDLFQPKTSISLIDVSGDPVNLDLPNRDAWLQGGTLKIDDQEYKVEINAPTIIGLSLPRVVLSGFAVHPYVEVEFTEAHLCKYSWYRAESESKFLLVSESQHYTPLPEDIGCKLKLEVVPHNGDRFGIPVELVTPAEVQTGPRNLPFEDRHKLTLGRSQPDGFRIVSYNILAEVYSDTDFSRDELFAYCPNDNLDYDYRKQLILKELIGYNSDIICLQELDKKHYNKFYQPILEKCGYSSAMLAKKHKKNPNSSYSENDPSVPKVAAAEEAEGHIITVNEGSAIFFKNDKFKQIGEHSMNIAETIESDPLFKDIMSHIEICDLVKQKLIYRSGASLQVLVLESLTCPGRRLCVSTTHLYFHPRGSVVRLFQTAISLRFLQHVKSMYSQVQPLPVIYCGDFNCSPTSASVKLLVDRSIGAGDRIWTSVEEYTMPGRAMRHDFNLDSAYGFPKYTNFTPSFRECLDYIFYDNSLLTVDSVVPIPHESILAAHNEGIPSPAIPSDHVALVSDISWKNSQ